MRRTVLEASLAVLLALPACPCAGAGSWLAAEVRAQEARWAAQQRQQGAPIVHLPRRTQRPLYRPARPGSSHERAYAATRAPRLAASPALAQHPTLPSVRGAGQGELASLILANASEHRLDPLLIQAVIAAESAGRRDATSGKGAMGLMQLMPDTALDLGVTDPYDPAQNLSGGSRYLRQLLDRYRGDVPLALAAYNAGMGRVARYGGIPPFEETRTYIARVQRTHALLQRHLAARLAGARGN
jgi:soluble lytic murein transglycosylase-like protein